ncbi:site-specific integrase [Granulosicoccaceae sp. 1_MG-2023]|nr:site-specific integrase [Granulosicoccaceae sp. 1_MG-2023]
MDELSMKDIRALIAAGQPCKKRVTRGLYICLPKRGRPYYFVRYTLHGRRREMTLGHADLFTRSEAIKLRDEALKLVALGHDPIAERRRTADNKLSTVDGLFNDWFEAHRRSVKRPELAASLYLRDVGPHLGSMSLQQVRPVDVRHVCRRIADSGRRPSANKALSLMQRLFRHGIKLGLIDSSPAEAFTIADAGGPTPSRKRALSAPELRQVLKAMREDESFGRENFLAVALLLVTCVRKNELLQARWSEFDLQAGEWALPAERSKTGAAIRIPLPPQAVEWLSELHYRAMGSPFVLPNRQSSTSRHVSESTLNKALSALFKADNLKGIDRFTVHDLRRTGRTLLGELNVPPHIAERCLNHVQPGMAGIYDRHDYYSERREALQKLAALISPMVNGDNVVEFPTVRKT